MQMSRRYSTTHFESDSSSNRVAFSNGVAAHAVGVVIRPSTASEVVFLTHIIVVIRSSCSLALGHSTLVVSCY